MAGFQQATTQVRQFWSGLKPKQQVLLGVGAVATIGLMLFFVRMIGTPDYKPLVTGMEPADAQTLANELTAKDIPHQLSADGKNISVPADKVDAARLEIASHETPHSGRLGFEIFDKVSWGQTEFDEKVNYQRALEGELERTIQTLSGVESARVHLVMPTESVFLDRERSAKASVTLKLREGRLSREKLLAISRLVAGAVDELKPEDVSIIDADSNQSLGMDKDFSGVGDSSQQELTQRLITTLEPVVGPDRIRASVNVEYDPGTTEQSEEKYDPNVSATLSMQRSEEALGATPPVGGVPGAASNVPNAKKTAAKADEAAMSANAQTSRTESATYGVNKVMTHTVQPAGRIRRITAALLVDDVVDRRMEHGKMFEVRRKRSADELKQIQDLAQAAIGLDPSRGDSISVQNLSFAPPVTDDLPPVSPIERVRKGLTDWSTAVRVGALLLLFLMAYVLMLRPIKNQALQAMKELPGRTAEQQVITEIGQQIDLPGLAASAGQRALSLRLQLVDRVKAEPVSSGRAVRAWLQEEV